jgi:hypothetical protein
MRQAIDVGLVAIAALCLAPQQARGNPRFEIDAVGSLQRSLAAHTTGHGGDVLAAGSGHVLGQQAFQPARTGCEIVVHRQIRRA